MIDCWIDKSCFQLKFCSCLYIESTHVLGRVRPLGGARLGYDPPWGPCEPATATRSRSADPGTCQGRKEGRRKEEKKTRESKKMRGKEEEKETD